jgi:hypothetical protein
MSFLAIMDSAATDAQQAAVLNTIDDAGGKIALRLGAHGAVVDGDQALSDSLAGLVGDGLTGVVSSEADIPADLDESTLVLVNAWLITQSPAFLAEMADPARLGQSWASLESGVGEL